MGRITICKEEGCKASATSAGLCRLHYLKRWKQLHDKKRKQAAKRLNNYIEYMCKAHPENYVAKIRENLSDDSAAADPNAQKDDFFFKDDEEAEVEIRHLLSGIKIQKDF